MKSITLLLLSVVAVCCSSVVVDASTTTHLRSSHPRRHQQSSRLNHRRVHAHSQIGNQKKRFLDEEQQLFDLDPGQGQGNFSPPPPTSPQQQQPAPQQQTSTSTSSSDDTNKWLVPTIIFSIAAILIIVLVVCIYQRRDDIDDTDSEWDDTDSEYSYDPGQRRRPTPNHYAEALKAIGRNNARQVNKKDVDDPPQDTIKRSSSRAGSDWKRPSGRKSPVDLDDDVSVASAVSHKSQNKSVKFLKPALKKASERKHSPTRTSDLAIQPSESEYSEGAPAFRRSPTDLSTTANKEASTGFCALPSFFGWGKSSPTTPPPPPGDDAMYNKKKSSSLRRLSKDDRDSTRGGSRSRFDVDDESVSDENRAKELMSRLQKEKKLEKKRSMRIEQQQRPADQARKEKLDELDKRPSVYHRRSELSMGSALQDMPHSPSMTSNGTSLYGDSFAYTYSEAESEATPYYGRYGGRRY